MKILNKRKKVSLLIICIVLIFSIISVAVYGYNQTIPGFSIGLLDEKNKDITIDHGELKSITYNVNPSSFIGTSDVKKDIILIIDTSQTMQENIREVTEAANGFVDKLLAGNGKYNFNMGIITYNESAEILNLGKSNLSNNPNTIKSAINSYVSREVSNGEKWTNYWDHMGTNVGDAFRQAIYALKNVDDSHEKVVIFMSNGKPNAYTGKFYKGPESYVDKNLQNQFNRDEKILYPVTSLNGDEGSIGTDDSFNDFNEFDNSEVEAYNKYFYTDSSGSSFDELGIQIGGLNNYPQRRNEINSIFENYYRVNNGIGNVRGIYGKNIYSVNLRPNNNSNAYFIGARIGYAYSLKMAKELKNNHIKTYPIFFENPSRRDNSARETTMKWINKFAGNKIDDFSKYNPKDGIEGLSEVFDNLKNDLEQQYNLNDAKLNLNIPDGVKVNKISYIQNGVEHNVNLDNMILPNIKYTLKNGTYVADDFQIKVDYEGENLTEKDLVGNISGSITAESIGNGSLGNLPRINATVKPGVNVKISVTDYIGEIGTPYEVGKTAVRAEDGSYNYFYNEPKRTPKTLIGNGFANISVKGAQDNENEDYWIKTWFTNDNIDQEISPEEFKLNNMNSDIMINKPNNLTYQSYNVNHLGTMDDEDAWNDRNQVFKSKQGNTGYLPTNKVAKYPEQYGTPENLNSTRPIYVYQGKEYELTNTKKVEYVWFDSLHRYLNAEVWTYEWSNNRTYEVYKYGDYWGNLQGGEVKEVSNWMWKPKTIFYDDMRVDDINYYNKYPGFSYKESDKYWGYLKPKESGWYLFGTYSDDGSRFSLTVNNSTYELANSNFGLSSDNNRYFISQDRSNFKVHGTALYTSFQPVYLEANKYYPMQLEYFNWGGGGAFRLGYCKLNDYEIDSELKNDLNELHKATINPNYKNSNVFNEDGYWNSKYYIKSSKVNSCLSGLDWVGDGNNEVFTMYPSKSNEPGDVANEVFEGKSGVKLPEDNGVYTMHYKIFTRANGGEKGSKILRDNIANGSYGKFEVKDLLNASIEVTDSSGGNNIYANSDAIVNYKMNPNQLKATDIIRDGSTPPSQIRLSDLKINGLIPKGLKFVNDDTSVNGRLESDGSTRIETNKMNDIIYTLKGENYIASEVNKEINVTVKEVGNFDFKSQQNTVGFKLKYNNKATDSMLEEFKGSSISINEPTKIEKFGILDSASPDNIKDVSEGAQVVNGMPLKIAILANIKSPTSVIDFAFNSNNIKNISSGLKVKVYNKGNLSNSINEFTVSKIDNNIISEMKNGIRFSNLGVGEKVMVIELIPDNIQQGESILLKTAVENSKDKPHSARLEYAEMPDVF